MVLLISFLLVIIISLCFAVFFLAKKIIKNTSKLLPNFDEGQAEKILQKNSFEILEKQKAGTIVSKIDGKTHLATGFADYIVKKENKKYAVKVASSLNVDLTEDSFRRSLMELKTIFPSYGLMVVNLAVGETHTVDFEFPKKEKETFFTMLAVSIIILCIVAFVGILIQIKIF